MSEEQQRNREKAFGEALTKLTREAREQGGTTTTSRVREIFAEFSLDEKQMADIMTYLRESHIGVDEASPDAESYLSDEEKDYLSEYLRSLEELPALTDRERERLCDRAVAGDQEAQKKLAEYLLRSVPDIARLYVQQGVFLEDLIGEGNVALMHASTLLGALDDPAETDASWQSVEKTLTAAVMNAMEAFIAENLQEDARGQRAVNRVNEVADRAKELYEDLRRPVTVEELMNETGWTRDKILDAVKLSGFAIEEIAVSREEAEGTE